MSVGSVDDSPVDSTLGRVVLAVEEKSVGAASAAVDLVDRGWMVRLDGIWRVFAATGRVAEDAAATNFPALPAVGRGGTFAVEND